MKTLQLIFTLLLLTFTGIAQNSNYDNSDTSHYKILENLIRKVQPNGHILYVDKFEIGDLELSTLNQPKVSGVTTDTKKNFIRLTKNEREIIFNSLKNFTSFRWKDQMFSNSSVYPADSLPIIEFVGPTDTVNMHPTINLKIKPSGIFMFSDIIFIRNKSVFLNYILWITETVPLHAELTFYKSENGIWKKWIVAYQVNANGMKEN